MNANIQHDI